MAAEKKTAPVYTSLVWPDGLVALDAMGGKTIICDGKAESVVDNDVTPIPDKREEFDDN